MVTLSKRQLFDRVEQAIQESGWNLLYLSDPRDHPSRYQIYLDRVSYTVRVYIWNLTHGGGAARPVDEYRIQVTGVETFELEIGGKTLILGWWDEVGVFAGFDYQHHQGQHGRSPSMQIREAALRNALMNGFCPHTRGGNELAIAFRPDFFSAYVENLETLHGCGEIPDEIDLLSQLGDAPDTVTEEQITNQVEEERRYTFISTKRALRDISFRARVLSAYGNRCAVCGLQLKLLDGAHILPASHPESTDETCNGVTLCTLHHRAYDRSLVTFDAEFRTHLNPEQINELQETGHDGGLDAFQNGLRPLLILPPDQRDRPNAAFVQQANEVRGWNI